MGTHGKYKKKQIFSCRARALFPMVNQCHDPEDFRKKLKS